MSYCVMLQVTERDDRMLMEQLTALEAANKEVAGDTDSEDDDDTGATMLCRLQQVYCGAEALRKGSHTLSYNIPQH